MTVGTRVMTAGEHNKPFQGRSCECSAEDNTSVQGKTAVGVVCPVVGVSEQ